MDVYTLQTYLYHHFLQLSWCFFFGWSIDYHTSTESTFQPPSTDSLTWGKWPNIFHGFHWGYFGPLIFEWTSGAPAEITGFWAWASPCNVHHLRCSLLLLGYGCCRLHRSHWQRRYSGDDFWRMVVTFHAGRIASNLFGFWKDVALKKKLVTAKPLSSGKPIGISLFSSLFLRHMGYTRIAMVRTIGKW